MEHNCDILVIGGGGSGLVAAVRAAELGKKVIILEKAKFAGGGMLFASTMRTFRSRWQTERNIPDQTVEFIRKMMDLTLWRLDPELVRAAVLGTGQFFDWYSAQETQDQLDRYEPRPYIFDIPTGGQVGPQVVFFHRGSGEMIVKCMLRRCGELGVDVLLQHRALEAESKDGRVCAVWADTPDGRVKFNCRAVILACSSWINNEEVMRRVLPEFLEAELIPNAHQNPAYTGDGLPIAEQLGAFIDWDSFCLRIMGPICGMGDHSKYDNLTKDPCNVLITGEGRRFAAEPLVPRMDPFDVGHVLLRLPQSRTWYLYSRNTMAHIIKGTQENKAAQAPGPFAVAPLPDLEVVEGWFRNAIAQGRKEVAMGDTPEELALQIGIDPNVLRDTVERYNASCALGEDVDFCKQGDGLVPLLAGPFYAMKGKLGTDGAFGGVRVNKQMQAYAADGGLVEGLFVTGDFASGRHIVLDGIKRQALNDMSWALSSGFIAGAGAANSLDN